MERYLAQRETLIAGAAPDLESARRLARLTDDALRQLAEHAAHTPKRRWALVALGGYGAGALLPASDLDLLLVSDESAPALKPFVECILYPLWDAGLAVGHQVRSAREHVRACRDDVQTQTATLTGRSIAGDVSLGEAVIAGCIADAHKHRRATLSRIAARIRPGSPYLLEPDLKEGAGGRRDYDEMVWTAVVMSGSRTTTSAPLVAAGLLTSEEHAVVERAADVVAAARWESQSLGLLRGPLTVELAADMQGDFRDVQKALTDTAQVCRRVRMRHAGEGPPDADLSAQDLFALIERGESGLDDLEDAAWSGALDRYIAEFSSLMTLRRPGLNHRYTVGAHSLRAAVALPGLFATAEGPLARSCAAATDLPALYTAALTHDVGKRVEGIGHARAGAEPAHDAALALGLRPSRAQDVADLVRHHLVLAQVATSDDTDDEDVVLKTAALIGRRELVAPLHLLTAADSLATSPELWGPWQATLVGALVTRLDGALSPETNGAGLAAAAESVRYEALTRVESDAERAFITSASLRYLAARTAADVLDHAALVSSLDGAPGVGTVRVGIGAGPADSTYTVSIAAPDRPETFSRVAGAIALAGLDILSADGSGTHAGVALDVFVVRSATLAIPDSQTWSRLERYLRAALTDRLELATRLAERRRHYPAAQDVRAPEIEFDRSAGYGTLVSITATDRVGLLHDLASAISETGLDIRWAKASTSAGVVRDTFFVTGPDGGPVDDPGVLGHLAMRVRELG